MSKSVPCNPHPDAPHGFDRNASHNEDRYVCNCEHWTPPAESLRNRIAAVQREHRLNSFGANYVQCECGWKSPEKYATWTDHPEHVADAVIAALPELTPESAWRASMNETRPDYILAIRAQALDKVQELIEPYENDAAPHPEAWARIVEAAFPPPPIAGGDG